MRIGATAPQLLRGFSVASPQRGEPRCGSSWPTGAAGAAERGPPVHPALVWPRNVGWGSRLNPKRCAPLRRSEIEGMMAIVVRGDALDTKEVDAAFAEIEEVDAVVSTIGGTPADPRADSEVGPKP